MARGITFKVSHFYNVRCEDACCLAHQLQQPAVAHTSAAEELPRVSKETWGKPSIYKDISFRFDYTWVGVGGGLQTFSRASCAAWEERANGTVCARVEDGAEVVVEKCGGEERRRRRLGRTRARVKARMVERVGARAGGIMRGKKAAVGGHIGSCFCCGFRVHQEDGREPTGSATWQR